MDPGKEEANCRERLATSRHSGETCLKGGSRGLRGKNGHCVRNILSDSPSRSPRTQVPVFSAQSVFIRVSGKVSLVAALQPVGASPTLPPTYPRPRRRSL